MENLSLKDRRRRQSIAFAPKLDSYDRYISRLPTPEESASSHRSSDDERRSKVTRRHSPDRGYARQSPDYETLPGRMRSPSSNARGIPVSPPYHPTDAQKPSLPPIKTILASSLNSPPRSPTFQCPSVQPSPQEPAYTSATYKPPSLYPQKKQRTEYHLEPVPPPATYDHSSPSMLTTDTFHQRSRRAPASSSTVSPQSRQLSIQPFGRHQATNHSGYASHPTQTSFAQTSPNAGRTAGDDHYRRTYGPAMSPPESYHTRQSATHAESTREHFNRRFERRDSAQVSYEATSLGRDRYHRAPVPPSMEFQANAIRRDEPPAAQYDFSSQQQQEPPYPPYQAAQPSFFMPSQYDYRQGRARKRSNLPKQSTEIMKTWFDQNITNPYPSEEQKAIFSNATGISMTQVSNWFINHRRRCPELRDKRERTRGRDGEV